MRDAACPLSTRGGGGDAPHEQLGRSAAAGAEEEYSRGRRERAARVVAAADADGVQPQRDRRRARVSAEDEALRAVVGAEHEHAAARLQPGRGYVPAQRRAARAAVEGEPPAMPLVRRGEHGLGRQYEAAPGNVRGARDERVR